MAQNIEKEQCKIEIKREKLLRKYEKLFAAHKYKGKGKTFTKEMSGIPDVLLASPYAVNCFETEEIKANRMTGALAMLLHYETGCRTMFTQKGFSSNDRELVKREYCDKLCKDKPRVIVELRLNAMDSNFFRIGEYGYLSNDNSDFFLRLAQFIIEYEFRDKGSTENVCGVYHFTRNFMIDEVANENRIPVLVIAINDQYFEAFNSENFERLYRIIRRIIVMLTELDWTADRYDVYRVWQANAKAQIPQDKIEFADLQGAPFCENAFIHICSFEGMQETARVNKINSNTLTELKGCLKEDGHKSKLEEYVILTNRLIERLFGREWIEGGEKSPGLRGIPIIVYETKRELYEIGIPKADQVENIALSTELYKEKLELSNRYDYLVFNRYSDSRIFIDIEKSDYKDNGRVKSEDGKQKALKVMLPRYYRLMLGYLDKPMKTIRAEEYNEIINNIPEKNKKTKDGLKWEITADDFKRCYKKMPGQAYFQLVEEDEVIFEKEKRLYINSKKRIISYLEKIGVYSNVDLIRIPKRIKPKKKLIEKIHDFFGKIRVKILKTTIGKAEYMLKTNWAGETDNKNSVARINSNTMSLMGVSENDKILIRFGENTIILRVLPQDDLSDYEIGIPSSRRRDLGMNSMNDIVIVHRDMSHIFKRHSQGHTIAILGTVLAVAQVLTAFDFFTESWQGILIAIIVCILAIIVMLYFALSEERVKVK